MNLVQQYASRFGFSSKRGKDAWIENKSEEDYTLLYQNWEDERRLLAVLVAVGDFIWALDQDIDRLTRKLALNKEEAEHAGPPPKYTKE